MKIEHAIERLRGLAACSCNSAEIDVLLTLLEQHIEWQKEQIRDLYYVRRNPSMLSILDKYEEVPV